jgi:hypothetical protein
MRSFRNILALSGAFTLAACGGDTGPQTVGGVAPPAGTPAPGTGTTPTPTHSFVAPTDPKTYEAIGAVQHFEYNTHSNDVGQFGQLYAGDANTARDSGISITYNPRDAIFDVTINRPKGLVSVSNLRFQDPMHRTAFGGPIEPQKGVPQFAAARQIQYLEAGSQTGQALTSASPYYTLRDSNGDVVTSAAGSVYPVMSDKSSYLRQTLFYQKPGTTTKYVTYAGFVGTRISGAIQQPTDPSQLPYLREDYSFDRAAFVFGERTANSAVPTSGRGVFEGQMIASFVVNVDPTTRVDATFPSYLQWIEGTSSLDIKFADLSVLATMSGTVITPALRDAYSSGQYPIGVGTPFNASGHATIDMINRGGFAGQFDRACFAATCTDANSLLIAGSSLDGTFFGPGAEEVGGGIRIVGGTPDQRIDILGAYTGKR